MRKIQSASSVVKIAAAAAVAAALPALALAQAIVNVEREGAEKIAVSVETTGSAVFKRCIERNLAISGAFKLVQSGTGAVSVTGVAGAGPVTAQGRGKRLSLTSGGADDAALRKEARLLADAMYSAYTGRKGFMSDPIAFVRKNGRSEELCVGYADGSDVRQITHDGTACVGPRWKDAQTILYTGFRNNAPQVFEVSAATGRARLLWGFGGLTACAAVSPGGSTAALIISKPFGNPELCTIDLGSRAWRRLTKTKAANEGQPAWSPDGRRVAYVSDETRRLHIYSIDVASLSKKRLTSTGTQNIDPDWGPGGEIAYITKRGGLASIAVLDPAAGDSSGRLVAKSGAWEHPSWARDGRHLVAERDGALFIVDTAEDGDDPIKLFSLQGRCITPSWYRDGGAAK